MKTNKVFNKLAATAAFAGILSAGLPNTVNAVELDTLQVCKQTNDSNNYRITFENNAEKILVYGEKDSGNRLDRGGVGQNLVDNYGIAQTDANIIVNALLPYDVTLSDTPQCTNDQLNIGTDLDTTSIEVCRPGENEVYYRITLDRNGQTLQVAGEKDSGKRLDREGVKQNLISNYNFNESDGQLVKDILLPNDILLTDTPLCTGLNSNIQLETVSTELVLSVDVSISVNSEEFELQRDGYIAAFQNAEVQQAIKDLPNGLAVTMQFWAENEVIDIGWFKLIENNAGGIDNLDSFISEIENVTRDLTTDQESITVGSRTAVTRGGTDIALAIDSAKNLIFSNIYTGSSLVIDVSGDGVSDDTPYSGVNEEDGDCPHAHFCPPLETARDAAVAAGITINGLPIVNNENTDQLTHEIDIHYRDLVIGGSGSFVEVANDFSGFTTAAKNKILREISGVQESDIDNNGILDKDEIDSDIDNDGLKNFEDLDDDGDNIADVHELYTPSQISNTGTKEMVQRPNSSNETITVTLPNPPSVNILPNAALNTGNSGDYDYQDTDSDDDTYYDTDEAGDTDLATAPINSDSPISGDAIADFRDLDSDDNGIIDQNEVDSDIDNDYKFNFQDLDDDGDGIIDLIEIGSNPASPTNSDGNIGDGYDYQDTDSDNDNILDENEGIKASATGTTSVSITYPNSSGTSTTYNLQDSNLADTNNDGVNCIAEGVNTCAMTSTSVADGKVTLTGKMTGLDYQVPYYAD